jgi:hypothetical protein
MARRKRPGDELVNVRKRAKRLVERYKRQGQAEQARSLERAIAASYERSGSGTTAERTQALRSVMGTRPATQSVPARVTSATAQPARQPRRKRVSDELYNARRRLRREADRLERDARDLTGAARDAALDFARSLRERAKAGKKLTAEQTLESMQRMGQVYEQARRTRDMRVARSNMIWMQQINAAGTEGADSSISERKKDVFWASVKGLWPEGSHVPRNERYDRILSHFYNDETTDAREFRAWLRDSKGVDPADVYGSLQYVYEYVTEELNDPSMYDLPEMPYKDAMNRIRMAM